MAMKSYSYTRTAGNTARVVFRNERFPTDSYNSPRVNGKLVLRNNPLRFQKITHDAPLGHYGDPKNFKEITADNDLTVLKQSTWYQNHLAMLRRSAKPGIDNSINKFWAEANVMVANVADLVRTRKETMEMVTNRLLKLYKSALALKRGNIRHFARTLGIHPKRKHKKLSTKEVSRNFGGLWLEYTYGWAPTLSDIYALLDQGFGDCYVRLRETSKTMLVENYERVNEDDEWRYSAVAGPIASYLKYTVSGELTVDASALDAAGRLGIANPSLLLWESLPFSFVVDWFYPVGTYLEAALDLRGKGCVIRNAFVTETITSTVTLIAEFKPKKPYIQWTGHCVGSGRFVYKNRGNSVPSARLPAIKNPVSADHFWNSLALLSQVFKK